VQYVCQQEFPEPYRRRKTAVPSRINLLSNRTSTIKWSHGIVMRIAVREKKRNWSLDCIMTTSTTKIKRYSTPSQALGYSLSLDQLAAPMGQFGL
jgi:hypothetical protein